MASDGVWYGEGIDSSCLVRIAADGVWYGEVIDSSCLGRFGAALPVLIHPF